MPLRVLIIPDKFKGTLTAHAAAETIVRGWARRQTLDWSGLPGEARF